MTKDKYFDLCEQMEMEPSLDKMPPGIEDFPFDVQKGISIFNKLGDRIFPDIGYLGKDYSQLPVLMDVYEIEDRKLFLETLLRLDAKIIQKSQAEIKLARERLNKS